MPTCAWVTRSSTATAPRPRSRHSAGLAGTLSALSDLLSDEDRLPEAAELLRTGLLSLLKF